MLEQAIRNPKFLNDILKGDIKEQDFIIYKQENSRLYKQYYSLNPAERLAGLNE